MSANVATVSENGFLCVVGFRTVRVICFVAYYCKIGMWFGQRNVFDNSMVDFESQTAPHGAFLYVCAVRTVCIAL